MGIMVNVDVMMGKGKIWVGEVGERIEVRGGNVCILKRGKGKGIGLWRVEGMWKEVEWEGGDILE